MIDATNDYLKHRNLEDLDALARVYAKNYASPHHITFTVEGLRHLVNDALGHEREQQAHKLYALENIRLLAARFRTQDWAKTVLRFCESANVKPQTLRNDVEAEPQPKPKANPMAGVLMEGVFNSKFKPGDLVRKVKGSKWQGKIVGWYSTDLTKVGWAVESSTETGSVQIYPESALEFVEPKSLTLGFEKTTEWMILSTSVPPLGSSVYVTDAVFSRVIEATVIPSVTPGAIAFRHKIEGINSVVAHYWRYAPDQQPTKLVDEDVALVLEAWDFSQFSRDNLRSVPTTVVEALHRVFEKLSNATLLVAPTVVARFETCLSTGLDKLPTMTGMQYVNVKGVEREDDNSLTVVLDYWPEAKSSDSETASNTLIDQLQKELKCAQQRITELEQSKEQSKYPSPWLGSYWYKQPPKKP